MRTCIQSSSGKAFHLFNFILNFLLLPLVLIPFKFSNTNDAPGFSFTICVVSFCRASLTRFFCLPLAWRSFLYFSLLCFCRLFLPESFCMCAMSEMLCVSVHFSTACHNLANVESIVKFRSCATKLPPRVLCFSDMVMHTKLSVSKSSEALPLLYAKKCLFSVFIGT